MKIQIEVTQRDIDYGVRENASSCAIARALKRQGFSNPDVCGEEIEFDCTKTDKHYEGSPPKWVEKWIDRFDESKADQVPLPVL